MAAKRGKKLNAGILSVRDHKCEGTFMGIRPLLKDDGTAIVSKSYGSELHVMDLASLENGEVLSFWADGGLRGSLKAAKVAEGQKIVVEYTGETQFEGGRVNTYDVFELVE